MGQNKPAELKSDFCEYKGQAQVQTEANVGEVIEAEEAERILNQLAEPVVSIPLWQGGYVNAVLIRFETEQWMRVFAYLPENGNRGWIWTGNKSNPAQRAWVIPDGYSLVKIEIYREQDGEWIPVYPSVHVKPTPNPDPTVRVCGSAPGSNQCDVNVYVYPGRGR